MLKDRRQMVPASGAFTLLRCVLIAAALGLSVTGGAWAQKQNCRVAFGNATADLTFELIDHTGASLGLVPPMANTDIDVFFGENPVSTVLRLRFPNGVPPAAYNPNGSYQLRIRVSRANCSVSVVETMWHAEGSGESAMSDRIGVNIAASISTGSADSWLIDITPVYELARRETGECEGDRMEMQEGAWRPTCQAERDFNTTVRALMQERADAGNRHAERCAASGDTFYVRPPPRPEDSHDITLCRPEAELGRDVFAGQTVLGVFTNLSLDRFNFADANLARSVFSGTRLSGANFARADLSGVNLSGVDLQGANLSGANLTGADLTGANLDRAILYNANFTNANMDRTRVEGADLTNARLSQVRNIAYLITSETTVICNTVGYNDEVINYNCITPVQFGDRDQSGRDYAGRDLAGLDFSNRNLQGVNFTGSTLTGVNFQGSDLSRANMQNADLTGADLSRANLHGVRLAGATLTRASLFQAQFDMGLYQTMSDTTVICETVGFDGDAVSINCPQTGH